MSMRHGSTIPAVALALVFGMPSVAPADNLVCTKGSLLLGGVGLSTHFYDFKAECANPPNEAIDLRIIGTWSRDDDYHVRETYRAGQLSAVSVRLWCDGKDPWLTKVTCSLVDKFNPLKLQVAAPYPKSAGFLAAGQADQLLAETGRWAPPKPKGKPGLSITLGAEPALVDVEKSPFGVGVAVEVQSPLGLLSFPDAAGWTKNAPGGGLRVEIPAATFTSGGRWHLRLRWNKPPRAEWTLPVPVLVVPKGKLVGADSSGGPIELQSPRPFDHIVVGAGVLLKGTATPSLPGPAKIDFRFAKIADTLLEGGAEPPSSNVHTLTLDPDALKSGYKWTATFLGERSLWGVRYRWQREGTPWSAERRLYVEPESPK